MSLEQPSTGYAISWASVTIGGAIMLSRCHEILLVVFCVGLAGASSSSAGSGVRGTLNSVGLMLSFTPRITHQWSLLGLNLWSNKAASNELLERDSTRFSRGELNEINRALLELSVKRFKRRVFSEEKRERINS